MSKQSKGLIPLDKRMGSSVIKAHSEHHTGQPAESNCASHPINVCRVKEANVSIWWASPLPTWAKPKGNTFELLTIVKTLGVKKKIMSTDVTKQKKIPKSIMLKECAFFVCWPLIQGNTLFNMIQCKKKKPNHFKGTQNSNSVIGVLQMLINSLMLSTQRWPYSSFILSPTCKNHLYFTV